MTYIVYNTYTHGVLTIPAFPHLDMLYPKYEQAREAAKLVSKPGQKYKAISKDTYDRIEPCAQISYEMRERWFAGVKSRPYVLNNLLMKDRVKTFSRVNRDNTVDFHYAVQGYNTDQANQQTAKLYGLMYQGAVVGIEKNVDQEFFLTTRIVDYPWLAGTRLDAEKIATIYKPTSTHTTYDRPYNPYDICVPIEFDVRWFVTRRDVAEQDLIMYTNGKLIEEYNGYNF